MKTEAPAERHLKTAAGVAVLFLVLALITEIWMTPTTFSLFVVAGTVLWVVTILAALRVFYDVLFSRPRP